MRRGKPRGILTPAQVVEAYGLARYDTAKSRRNAQLAVRKLAESKEAAEERRIFPRTAGGHIRYTDRLIERHMPELMASRTARMGSRIKAQLAEIDQKLDSRIDRRIDEHPRVRANSEQVAETTELLAHLTERFRDYLQGPKKA